MNISLTTTAPELCPYVALSDYSWAIRPIFLKPRGACHGVSLDWNFTVICLFVALHAVGVWMALAIILQAFITFKRWSTTYFWSIITTACGIILYALTVDIMFLTNFGNMIVLGDAIYAIATMVTYEGFLLVLYSRFHLIVDSPRLLRALLFVILGVGIPLQIVMILSGDRVLSTSVWVVMFRIEMLFPCSEIVLSALYVFLFIRFVRQSAGSVDVHMKRTFHLLILAEIFVVIAEIVGITLWFLGLYLLRLAVLPFLYALKLKVEFMILNRLTGIGKRKNELRNLTLSVHEEVGEVQVMSPCTFQSAAPTLTADKGLGIGLAVMEDGVSEKTSPTNGIRETSSSAGESGSPKERDSLDEIERRYLGSYGRGDGMV